MLGIQTSTAQEFQTDLDYVLKITNLKFTILSVLVIWLRGGVKLLEKGEITAVLNEMWFLKDDCVGFVFI